MSEQKTVDGFVPFGPEWEAQMMKMSKADIIETFRGGMKRKNEEIGRLKKNITLLENQVDRLLFEKKE